MSYIYQKNIKKSYKNNWCKMLALTRNEKFDLLDGLYFVLDIQDYFEYILKKNGEEPDDSSITIYANKK